ncbi:S41 family peptidase [Kribbella deserti]|uniref:S41 family peptidase n=1 Tax=Kribbella deserti TaxID=1926257 RepID=A0ABV6QMY3_9ACTN
MRHGSIPVLALISAFALATGTATAVGVPSGHGPAAPSDAASAAHRHLALVRAAATGGDGPPAARMSATQLAASIDATWGEGLPTARKLEIFDGFWTAVDQRFAAFQGIEHVDWPALRDRYRPEVAAGVSRGRFAAIMNHLSMALRESHTVALDREVNQNTLPAPGVPLLWHGPWLTNTFGACTTAQADGSALIIKVSPSHPLGLDPGDRVLGFEGRPWTELYPELLQDELPIYRAGLWGSSPNAFRDNWIASGPMNWYLFDTIDVLKHDTGTVQHLATAPLATGPVSPPCSEQVDLPGIAKPQLGNNNTVTWGILPGTSIGYVYVWGWFGDAATKFTQAIEELTQQRQTDGLILDFRFNLGGNMFFSDAGMAMLFDGPKATVGFDVRKYPHDHFAMKPGFESGPSWYIVDNNADPRSYNKPIAVLTGPGAVSSGDQVALRAALHPNARVFGRTTAAAFNAAEGAGLDAGWLSAVAVWEAYRVGAPNNYLTHDEFAVDEPVSLTPDDVAAGRDTVVDAAVDWISTGN